MNIDNYSPWDLLPAPVPSSEHPKLGYFYDKVSKYLIKDVIRVMNNGIPIDLDKVKELETTLDTLLAKVQATINSNPIIIEFQKEQYKHLQSSIRAERTAKLRPVSDFITDFRHNNMEHRSAFMQSFAASVTGISTPDELTPIGLPKWTANMVKRYQEQFPILRRFLAGELPETNPHIQNAIQTIAEIKAERKNRIHVEAMSNISKSDLPEFNPGSSLQKEKLFHHYLGMESEKLGNAYIQYQRDCARAERRGIDPSEVGLSPPPAKYSWDRDEIERINRETNDPNMLELTQAMIDYSFGAIVRDNFINAFYKFTIDGVLYGNIKLFGAKTFRLTSSEPNLLNMPSTKSIYSKPVKQCFVAPPDYMILAIDYGALEDRVIASLTKDKNKCSIFTDGLDGHCLNAYGYFKEEIAEHMPITGDTTADVKEMYRLVEAGNSALKAIRQKGKPATLTHKRLYAVMHIE